MDEGQARDLADRFRRAQGAGAPVEELLGEAARNFVFVSDVQARPTLCGTFRVAPQGREPFYVSVVIGARGSRNFQMFVMDRMKGSPVIGTSKHLGDALLWRYLPAKQSGDNARRKLAFHELAGDDSLRFPLPSEDIGPFAAAVARAIDLRTRADAAGGDDDESDTDEVIEAREPVVDELREWIADPEQLATAARWMTRSIAAVHAHNPRSWCVTRRRDRDVVRLNVGFARLFDISGDEIRIAVALGDLDDTTRDVLGTRLDRAADQQIDTERSGNNADVVTKASDLDDLPPTVAKAHRSLLVRAARASTPFARCHSDDVLDALREITGEDVPDPDLPTGGTQYWKLSPGENAAYWDRFRDDGFVAVGWDVGDLSEVDEPEFARRAEGKAKGIRQLWKFRNIAVGDRIVANHGTSAVLGVGTVIGPYHHVAGQEFPNRLRVRWDDLQHRQVDMKGWNSTLIRLTKDDFDRIVALPGAATVKISSSGPGIAAPRGGTDFEGILAHLRSRSLWFPPELVACTLLALQARRFLLLTGISGTGKTRLAQELAHLLAPSRGESDATEITVKPYMLRHSRFVMPADLARDFDALTDPEAKRLDVKMPGRSAESMAIYKDPARPSMLYVLLSGGAKEWLRGNVKEGDRLELRREASSSTEWLIVERPRTGVSAAVSRTHEIIGVRPDWTDNRGVLGFFNPLTSQYQRTPFLDLCLRASAEDAQARREGRPPTPYFAIFDEMNLARVEHWFSDVLSAMESDAPIPLHTDRHVVEAEDVPERLTLPRNLFLIGTVNVDETTYMFSPKVLDRAFVLEFNDVDLDALGDADAGESAATALSLTRMPPGLELLDRPDDSEWTNFAGRCGERLRQTLLAVHGTLREQNRHFGYRVAREIGRFVELAARQTDGSDAALEAALDVAILAKVLPKLHGTQPELEVLLGRLIEVAAGHAADAAGSPAREGLLLSNGSTVQPLPRTARKLRRMRERLLTQGFVSFIE